MRYFLLSLPPSLLLGLSSLLEGSACAAEGSEGSYYREAHSYSSKRVPDPPAYVHSLAQMAGDSWRDYDWLKLGLEFRFRYEYRDDDLRRPTPGRDEPLLYKTHFYLGVTDILDPLRFAIELQDSRRENSDYVRDDRDVNEFEFINLYAELYFEDALGRDPLGNARPVSLRAGRMTFEFLDRRLIASNPWRNTTNTFQGFRVILGQELNEWQLDLLAVQPLARLKYDWDRPVQGQWLYGAIGHWRGWSDVVTLEPYYLRLTQDDLPGVIERDIQSVGLRGYGVVPGTGFDYDIDALFQFGRNGAQQHRAAGLASEVGYTFTHDWNPRLSVFYGYATGDRDPADNRDERFERYIGFSRSWSASEYIIWENISALKVRIEAQPNKKVKTDATCSGYWLASATDEFNRAGLRDATGRSGTYLGSEFDARVKYAVSKRVEVNLGYAHFIPGEFTRNRGKGWDSDFFYFETTISAF